MRIDRQAARWIGLVVLLLGAAQLWAGPHIQSWQTANGAKVLFVEAPGLPMVDLRVVFDAGSARDGSLPGLAALTSSLLTEGAGPWDANQIAERLEAVGAEMDAGALRDMAWVSVRTLTESGPLDVAVETITAVLGQPRFEGSALQRNRQAMLVALRRDEQNPGTVAQKAFYRAIFGDHPYATDTGGSAESLAAITHEDVQGFHRRHYVAANAVVAIVGDLDRTRAEQLAQRVTDKLAVGQHAPLLPEVPALSGAQWVSKRFPSSQTHVLMGQPGMHRGDPDYFVLYLGNHILGGSGLVSLLSEEVREKRGLSYSVYSYFSPMRRNGPFVVGAQTQNAKAGEAIEVMQTTLQRFMDEGPSEQELEAAKRNITGGFPLRIASNSKIVEYLAMIGFYDLPLDYLDRFVGRIEDISAEQIRSTFQRRLDPQRFVTVTVGNGETSQQGG